MPITNTDLPPKNTSIKYRRSGESHFTAGKTSKQQPKRKGKHRGYVNFLAENTEKEEYSVEWKNIEEWFVCEDEDIEGVEANEGKNSDDSRKTEESSEDDQQLQIESYRESKDSSSESHQSDEKGSSNESTLSEKKESSNESTVSIIDRDKETYEEEPDDEDNFMNEYNRELPPYQLPRDNSEPYFSAGESVIVDKMHQMSIHDESEIEQFKTRKRTPIKEKIQKLRRELKNEKEKVKELEQIINKITNEDSSEIKKELANALKTQNIYKEEVRKFMNKSNAEKNEIDIIETDFHPNTMNAVHLKKCELLNENSTLHKKIDKLKTEINQTQKSKDELSEQLREEKQKNNEYDLLQLKMLEIEATNPNRGETESNPELLKRKEAEIETLKRNLIESKHQLNEWMKESSSLRRINNQLVEENSQIKAIQAKDQVIQSKNENIIMLQNETLNLYRQFSHKKNRYVPNASDDNESPLQSSEESVVVHEDKRNRKIPSSPKHQKILSKTKKRQGLPNEKKNACYIITTMHALAMSIPRQSQQKKDPVMKLIKDTRNCLEGHKNEEEAQKIIQDIWQFTISQWPENYQNRENEETRIRQQDSAEYLRRVIQNDKISEETEMYINTNLKCFNNNCPAISNEERKVSNIIEYFGDKEEITLQEIIDSHVSQGEHKCLKCHGSTSVTNVIKQAPNVLIIEVCRGNDDQTISKIKIKNPERNIEIEENGQKVSYKTCAIIKHQGEEQISGHYIVNCYNENVEKWEEIDDDEIKILQNMDKNESGLIYILRKESKSNQKAPNSSIEKQIPLYSTMAKRPGNNQPNHEDRPNYSSQYSSMPRGGMTVRSGYHNNNKEIEMINLKKNNVIIRGIQERNKESDIKFVVDMNKLGIGNYDFDRHNIVDVERLGENYEKGRPLKVEFDSYITKVQMMRNLYLLKEDERYKGINIQHDLTKTQVIEYTKLIQQSIETEQKDRSGKYKYRVRGPPGKWEIVKIQKNSR